MWSNFVNSKFGKLLGVQLLKINQHYFLKLKRKIYILFKMRR